MSSPGVTVTYKTAKFWVRIAIGHRHDPFKVLEATLARMFPDADPHAPDPAFDRAIRARDAALQRRRREARG